MGFESPINSVHESDSTYHEVVENFKDSIIKAAQKFVRSCETKAGESSSRSYYLQLSNLCTAAAEEAIQQYWYHRGYE